MKIIRIEFHVESDDDGDTESVGKGFTCEYEKGVAAEDPDTEALLDEFLGGAWRK